MNNVNELLEKRKEIEKEIESYEVRDGDLKYELDNYLDHEDVSRNRKVENKKKVKLVEYLQRYNGLCSELAKIKATLLKFNAAHLSDLLFERERCRQQIKVLQLIKERLPKDSSTTRHIVRQHEGKVFETLERTIQPMFNRDEVQSHLDQLAAEERKLNTEIQKRNLNAEITI